MKPQVEFVATGNELLNGSTLNRHTQWLGGELGKIGWKLSREVLVPDVRYDILQAVRDAFSRVDVVITSGGLGPTSDDLTRDAASEWLGRGIVMHEPSRIRVREIYAARNKPLNTIVENHALVVDGARVLDNREGLAPGEHLEREGKHLFILPGPPREFHAVMLDHVLPWMSGFGVGSANRQHTFQVIGHGESDLVDRLNRTAFAGLNVNTEYCANPSHIYIRLREQDGQSADFDAAVALVRNQLGHDVFSEDERPPAQMVLEHLDRAGKTLAAAESCTGGMLGSLVTAVPGSSQSFRGGIVAYHNEIKSSVLRVPTDLIAKHGAVSEAVARSMAEGVRQVCGSDIGVAITGVAGPGGVSRGKPAGLVYVCAASADQQVCREVRLGGDRSMVREASCMIALDLVRRMLQSAE